MVWLDSDAFVRDVTLDLPSLLRRYGDEPSTSRGARAADTTDAYFGWDAPYSLGPNAGFAVLRGEGGEDGEGGEGGGGEGTQLLEACEGQLGVEGLAGLVAAIGESHPSAAAASRARDACVCLAYGRVVREVLYLL